MRRTTFIGRNCHNQKNTRMHTLLHPQHLDAKGQELMTHFKPFASCYSGSFMVFTILVFMRFFLLQNTMTSCALRLKRHLLQMCSQMQTSSIVCGCARAFYMFSNVCKIQFDIICVLGRRYSSWQPLDISCCLQPLHPFENHAVWLVM